MCQYIVTLVGMDDLNRIIVDCVLIDKRGVVEVAEEFNISRQWVRELVNRFEEGGYEALKPKSRKPTKSPTTTGQNIVDKICEIHKRLEKTGFDAGARTVRYHLVEEIGEKNAVSVSTIHRYLKKMV